MKKVILLVLFMPFPAYGQILENFESGMLNNWVQNIEDRWKADSVGAVSGKYSLHHSYDNPGTGIDKIGLQVRNLHLSEGITRWTFQVRHGYDPSSSNNWALFLMSDRDPGTMSIDGGTNGYALGVNLSGYDDTLRLTKINGSVLTTIVNCRVNWQTEIGSAESVKIVVERSSDGSWDVSVFRLNGTLIKQSGGTDNEVFSPVWFSVWYKYSSTRDRLLWIDEIKIEGVFYEDTEAPLVTSCKELGRSSLRITLSEQTVDESLVPENFSLNTTGNKAIKIVKKSPLIYDIEFSEILINKFINTLIVNELCDKTGNCSTDLSVTFYPVWAEPGDVIISEIMADPLPRVSLPVKEYLEITNNTDYSFNLKCWKLLTEDQEILFPEIMINSREVKILCNIQDTSLFKKYGRVIGLRQFPSLTDNGKVVSLADSSQVLIHGVDYSSEWYGTELKATGGWSLEMIDPLYPFSGKVNWVASSSRLGGTPGTINSVNRSNPDTSFQGILNVFSIDSMNIIVTFSEPVFSFKDSIGEINIGENSVTNICHNDLLYREFSVKPSSPLVKGVIYQLDLSDDIKDFAGNKPGTAGFRFGLTEQPLPGDILFNELMFNPLPGDPDYIEFYNNSTKIIDASRIQIVSIDDAVSDTSQCYPVSAEGRCILPNSYYAITTDTEKVKERFFSADNEYLFETGVLPLMPDKGGHLILFNKELDRIDEVFYYEEMHDSLLTQFEGTALEKTSPDTQSEVASNWHSASKSSGWGTPGAPNLYISIVPPYKAKAGDVIISEIMADPSPIIFLPPKEYIEITNRADSSFNLKNWMLSFEEEIVLIPETLIQPGQIMIICSVHDTSLFSGYGRVIGLKQIPSLSDAGGILCLYESSGTLIHGVEYSSDWYGNELKSEGGWSLEMVDTRFPFFDQTNWVASKSRSGGSPGTVNSVTHDNQDLSFYGIRNVFPYDRNKIRIRFSEPVFDLQESLKSILIGENNILSLAPADPLFREFLIILSDNLQVQKEYQFNISEDIVDFAGNSIESTNYIFGLPETPEPGDILFNELLFNPLPGDADYIELFNCSEKVIDASGMQIVSVDDALRDTSRFFKVSDEGRCILPNSYFAITVNSKKVKERYFSADPDNLFETDALPSMNDENGHLILYNKELDRIDEVFYNEKMHYSLLIDYEGVALEKTSPGQISGESVNWHSAAESAGWGTPGAPNSLYTEQPVSTDKIKLSFTKITPDNDGNEDFLNINFSLMGSGNIISVSVFDEKGNYIKKVASNLLAAPESTLLWDGTADDGTPVRTGIYIIYITLYNDSGKTEKWKKVCTVIR